MSPPATTTAAPPVPVRHSQPVRVLLADDTPTVRLLLRHALEASGAFEVVAEAGDGKAAVDAAIRHRPDLVLLDLAMPVMDGLQALPLLRAGAPESVVVVLSGFTEERMGDQAMALGAAGYLEKTGSPTRLVDSILALTRPEASAPARPPVPPPPLAPVPVTVPMPEPVSAVDKSQLLATMSHELRTPLQAVVQASALLAQSELPPEVAEWSDTVRSSAEALTRIANDILDFAKVDAGMMMFERRPFSVAGLVEDALAIIRPEGSRKGLALLSEIAPEVPAVCLGDKGRLRQVLVNLLANAVRFTEQGYVRITVYVAGPGPGLRTRLAIAVSDSGVGIEPQHVDRIFEPYAQTDTTTACKYGGTGLGLSICRGLVTLMGGEMSVNSAPSEGSTFTATVVLDAAREEPAVPAAPPSIPSRHRGRVLIFEDDPAAGRLTVRSLEAFGFEALACGTGGEGLARFRADAPFVAVLMDSMLPDMDGVEAARRIRCIEEEDPDLGRTPVIALTGAALPADRERCLAAGMDDYLCKPASPSALNAMLTRWTSGG